MSVVKVRRVKPYTGYNSGTPDNLLLDAGVLFKNFNVNTDTYASAKAAGKCLGATQKGVEFSAVPNYRRMEIDGVHSRTIGDTLPDDWVCYIKSKLIEITKDNLLLALSIAQPNETVTKQGYTEIRGRSTILPEDYIGNITYIGNILGKKDPIIIQVFNAFHEGGLVITSEDKNNAGIECQFYGYHSADIYDDVSTELEPPFAIWVPDDEEETEETSAQQNQGGNG